MSWNHRVVKKGGTFGIHEVYYTDEGDISGVSQNPVGVMWNDDEKGLDILVQFKFALEKPILIYEDIVKDWS